MQTIFPFSVFFLKKLTENRIKPGGFRPVVSQLTLTVKLKIKQ